MSVKVEAHDHWREELTKLRCWLSGFKEGRTSPGGLEMIIPGEDVLRQIIITIDMAELGNKNDKSKSKS